MARPVELARGSKFVVLASVCVVVAALYFAQVVLIPLALAILFSFLLTPVVVRLERAGLARVPSVMVVVVLAFALVLALGWVVTAQVVNLAGRLDDYKVEIVEKVENFKGRFAGGGGIAEKIGDIAREVEDATTRPASQPTSHPVTQSAGAADVPGALEQIQDDPLDAAVRGATDSPPKQAPPLGTTETNPVWVAVTEIASPVRQLAVYLGVIAAPFGTAGLVLVFVIFMLIQREDLRDRIIRLVGHGQLQLTTQALDDAATRISRYLMAQAIVNGTYGIGVSLGLWLIGNFAGDKPFPSFVLWGLLCAVLRFIPYIGPWIAAVFPIVLSLAVYDGFGAFFWTAGMFVVIELLSNNLMEPWLYGSSTGMTTVAVLVSAVFWTWLWGPVGLLLATPLTVCLVVMGKYVPQLQFLDILLGDEPVLEPQQRVYQRLLAMDQEEATDLVHTYHDEQTLEEIYDNVLAPALAMAERDRHSGRLEEDRQKFIHRAMRDIIEELGDAEREETRRQTASDVKEAAAQVVSAAKGEARLKDTAPALPSEKSAGAASPAGDGNGKPVDPASAPAVIEDASRAERPTLPKDCTVNVAILPAHDEADEIVGLMLTQLLELRGYCAFPESVTKLAGEMIETVEQRNAHVVCVSAMPPAAVAHSRYLCKRLHARIPDMEMVVGLWTVKADLKKAKDRIACTESVRVIASLHQALEQITQLAQPILLKAENATRSAAAARS